jgi:hypothetical protein
MAARPEDENRFVRLMSLFLEIAPLPMRQLLRNRWDARYPQDKWHAGDGSDAERKACGQLLMRGSESCSIELPCPFKRGKGNMLEPDSGHVALKDFFKPGDRVLMERRDLSNGAVLGDPVEARVAKKNALLLETSMIVEAPA